MTDITAILFDLDGVLVEAKEWHYESLNRALRLFGYEINRVDHLTTFDGLPTRKKLEYLSVTQHLPRGLHQMINRLKQNYTKEMIAVNCFPVFPIEYALSRLKRAGYGLAVCSNSVRETLDLMLSRSGLDHYFDFTLSNEDCGRPKPAPDIYVEAMRRLGVTPERALIIEDNQYGIEAAKAAGGRVLEVRDPTEVNYWNIVERIHQVEGGGEAVAAAAKPEPQFAEVPS